MQKSQSPSSSVPPWLASTGMILFGAVISIFLIPFLILRWLFGTVFGLSFALEMPSLADPDQQDRITLNLVKTTPMQDVRDATIENIRTLVKQHQWAALGDQLQDWDQSRAKCPGGDSLADLGIKTALQALSAGTIQASHCMYEKIMIIEDDVSLMLETQAALHSDKYALAVLAARARVAQGWAARGPDYAYSVSEERWTEMGRLFDKAQWLLGQHDPVTCDAPMLAAARFDLLSFLPDADKLLDDTYATWTQLDPTDQDAHAQYGFKLLPRWYGTSERLQIAAQSAALRTQGETGAAAYASMYLEPLRSDDGVLLDMDADMFHDGVLDLADFRNNDPAALPDIIYSLLDALEMCEAPPFRLTADQAATWDHNYEKLNQTYATLIRTRLTAIRSYAWPGGKRGALECITRAFQADFDAGASFIQSETGIKAVQPESDNQNA